LAAYARKSDTLRFDLTHAKHRRLGDYELHELLGEGGMGAVYRAHQISLDRDVAVKVLSAQWATPDFADRFHHEAQNAARLEHPNIVAIHEVGTAEELHFYSMHLVRGQTLAGKLQHDGVLNPQAAAALMIPIARAIDYAHHLSVLRLDLKPANVLIDGDGVPHVADFGLARRMERELALTNDEVCGTPSYMAPEQATSGLEKISPATDVWGLGAILYELVSGQPPFLGATPHDTIQLVRTSTPRPVRSLVPTLPRDLQAIIDKCLTREVSRRYANAAALADDLAAFVAGKPVTARPLNPVQRIEHWVRRERTLAITAATLLAVFGLMIGIVATTRQPMQTAISDKSIAVLPFVNRSQDKDQEFFSDGISEDMLNLLSKVRDLKVISRSSSFSFKGKDTSLREIATTLGVAYILEGSVQRAGKTLRISAQLIDARSDHNVWSESYDRPFDDVFAIQDEIAGTVVGQLKLKLLGQAQAIDPEAYALFLQARQLVRLGTRAGYEQAIPLFQQVLAKAPGYAPAWDQLAAIYSNQAASGLRPVPEGVRLAREALDKALTADPNYAPAYAILGSLESNFTGDLSAAVRHFERALALDPADPIILGNAAGLAQDLGRLDLAIALQEAALALDPVSAGGHFNLGGYFLYAHRWEEAIASFRTALRLSPGRVDGQASLGLALLQKGDAEAALAEVQKEPEESWRLVALSIVYHALGRSADSDAALADLIAKYEKEDPSNIAYVLAYRGEADRAFEWLDKAQTYEDSGLSDIVVLPQFDNIRKDPRWLPLLRKLGKDPETLAKIEFKVTLPADKPAQ
jgi:serine/threonine protein kinase/Tfp pilus assembly protein PilF